MNGIPDKIVIIGGGQAGFSTSGKLRNMGYRGDITLVGEEPLLPYQRPPLSKAYLLGDMTPERLFLRPPAYYAEQNITLMTNVRAERIHRDKKAVHISGGAELSYDKLVLCTGSRPVTLPTAISGNLAAIYYVRTMADVDAMVGEFCENRRVLVAGGGYIGLEAASIAAKLGVKTTIVEVSDRILQRVASTETSDYFRALHKSHGVDIREGVMLSRLTGKDGRVTGAILSDGSKINVDFVIAGVGIRPNQSLADEAGLAIDNGIRVNEHCQTSDPDILAAGDCTSFPFRGDHIRLENVGNAIAQAEAAAATIMGSRSPYLAIPWFWSDQFDTKLQIVGLSAGYDTVVTRRTDENTVSFWYFAQEELLAVDAMNDPRSYMVAKRLIETGKTPDQGIISNLATELKSLLKT